MQGVQTQKKISLHVGPIGDFPEGLHTLHTPQSFRRSEAVFRPGGGIEMALVEISTTPLPDDREELFVIDGVSYTIPVEVPGSFALQMLQKIRTEGPHEAEGWALEEMIGPAGVKALRECRTLRKPELLAIMKIVRERALGAAEEEGKG